MVLFKILQTDLKMQLTGTSNDVLPRLFDDTLHHRVGFGQTFQTFYKFWQIGRVLGFDGDTHDGG
ncbi:hypothetical protein OS176_14140, partial [Xanthomonadaceae bacterium XH05]|nr:hypothetical protein [Xanthomonadaceae bacterium XH05]